MAKIVKQKRKLGSRGSGSSGREQSPLRPYYQPKLAPCYHGGCPNENRIRDVTRVINNYDFKDRTPDQVWRDCFAILSETTPLPATCGRVCPALCQDQCNRAAVDGDPVHVRCLERFIGDWALEHGLKFDVEGVPLQAERVAIIGSGPAGLAAAYHLARLGYRSTIFEAFPKAGGMLRYGIPDYRLPPAVLDAEIQRILDTGRVELKTGVVVGKDLPYEQLKRDYQAVFVGIGAHKGYTLGVEGENAENVMTGTGFLNLVNGGRPVSVGDKVVVIGGGDTAIDAARIARRLGAAEVRVVYRRTIAEMPAIKEEIEEAQKEGIQIDFLAAPVKIHGENGRATGMRCIRMELGEPDSSGRRRPVPVQGSEFDLPATFIIPAISQEPDFAPLSHLREGKDWVKIDADGRAVAGDGLYAGGDVVALGLATIALAQGRHAAEAMHRSFRGLPAPEEPKLPKVDATRISKNYWLERPVAAVTEAHLQVEEALADLHAETTRTIDEEQARQEASRCLSCGLCFECENCFKFCTENGIVRPPAKGGKYEFKLHLCTGCKKCMEECPCGYIDMQ